MVFMEVASSLLGSEKAALDGYLPGGLLRHSIANMPLAGMAHSAGVAMAVLTSGKNASASSNPRSCN
jgi:hypothetical protein